MNVVFVSASVTLFNNHIHPRNGISVCIGFHPGFSCQPLHHASIFVLYSAKGRTVSETPQKSGSTELFQLLWDHHSMLLLKEQGLLLTSDVRTTAVCGSGVGSPSTSTEGIQTGWVSSTDFCGGTPKVESLSTNGSKPFVFCARPPGVLSWSCRSIEYILHEELAGGTGRAASAQRRCFGRRSRSVAAGGGRVGFGGWWAGLGGLADARRVLGGVLFPWLKAGAIQSYFVL